MRKSILRLFFIAMASSICILSVGAASALAANKGYFIDLLYLQDGKTAADAKGYFDKVVPIIAKHGLVRIAPSFEIIQKMGGNIEPNLVNVWSVSDKATTMQNIFSDPDYLENIPLRNSIFNMGQSHMFMMRSVE